MPSAVTLSSLRSSRGRASATIISSSAATRSRGKKGRSVLRQLVSPSTDCVLGSRRLTNRSPARRRFQTYRSTGSKASGSTQGYRKVS